MARQLKTEAIVLKKNSLLNKDTIITLFTEELGKVGVFAKGIKKITSKRLPHMQTGNLITAILHQSNTAFFLQDTQLISGFSAIKASQEKIHSMYVFFFILERLLPDHQKEESIYVLTKSFEIHLANEKKNNITLLDEFLNKLKEKLGYIDEKHSYNDLILIIEELIHEKVPAFSI